MKVIETHEDAARVLGQVDFIRESMADGQIWTVEDLCDAYEDQTGKTMKPTSCSANIRTLRKPEHGGFSIERIKLAPGHYGFRMEKINGVRVARGVIVL